MARDYIAPEQALGDATGKGARRISTGCVG